MDRLRRVLWTLACVGMGIVLATVPVLGHTPWQYAVRAWHSNGADAQVDRALDHTRDAVEDAVDKVKDRVQGRRVPSERHSAAERQALNDRITRPIR